VVCPDSTSICQRTAAAPGQRTIAVFGDSEARSLDAGFFELARRNGWGYVLAAHNGCGLTGMLNIEGTQIPQFLRDCAAQTPGRVRQVLDQYHPDLVISLSRWEIVAHVDADGRTVQPQTAQWTQEVHAGLLSFAQTVTGSGARLAALAVLPLAQDRSYCARKPGTPSCTQVPDPLTAAVNQLYDQVGGEVAGMSVVQMQDVICPDDRCREAVDGLLVRFDGEHFTADGARWFVDRLAQRLL
jgi:lysophospholipase L1-like esterase